MTIRAARIRTRWKNPRRETSPEEHAAAVAAAAWRTSLNAAKNLHARGFDYAGDAGRFGVMREYLYFLIHAADRNAHDLFDDSGENDAEHRRATFITELVHACARHYLENARDAFDADATRKNFIAEFNARAKSYARHSFNDGAPGHDAYRALGAFVQDCMPPRQKNKWTQDQVMNIDAPQAFAIFARALQAINASAAGEE